MRVDGQMDGVGKMDATMAKLMDKVRAVWALWYTCCVCVRVRVYDGCVRVCACRVTCACVCVYRTYTPAAVMSAGDKFERRPVESPTMDVRGRTDAAGLCKGKARVWSDGRADGRASGRTDGRT